MRLDCPAVVELCYSCVADQPSNHVHSELQVNSEIVAMQRVQTSAGETQLRELLEAHVEYTDSTRAKHILSDWKNNLGKFWQLVPPSEAGTPEVYASEDNLIKHEGSQKESVDPAPAKF